MTETEIKAELNDPRISGKEEKWEFEGVQMSAVFRHKGTPEHGYMYVYQLHARIANMDYGQIYNPDKFSFEEAREHFEEIIKRHLTRKEPK